MTRPALDDYQRTTGATKGEMEGLERLDLPAWDQSRPKLALEAFYGLAGRIVETIQPHTEADPVATLVQTLTLVGNLVGPGPHARVERDEHPCRLFIGLVGRSGGARKGTSLSTPRYLIGRIDECWRLERFKQGLSSGEGLIENVRDPMEPEGEEAAPEEPLDRRLMIIEPELAVVLKNMSRESNTLSAILRQAWDSGNLSTLTRHSPLKATGAHISVIGHITQEELRRYLTETERANGFANRFIWVLVERSKLLPEGGGVPDAELDVLIDKLRDVVEYAGQLNEIRRDEDSREIWAGVYGALSAGKPGMLGAILSRAEAQVLRLSVLYAVLDRSRLVKPDHLKAALALWEYAEASARMIFGSRLGNTVADRILQAIRQRGELTETQICALFSGHERRETIQEALLMLAGTGRVQKAPSGDTGGRPVTVWGLAKKAR